jgi:O-methyltransferase involved in polyketide biosynthesis
LNNVNKTLYIPLYGKAFVSKKGIILQDKKAEEIWEKEQFPLKGKSKSKWLAYYMSMRSAVFDEWTKEQTEESPDAVVLHLGCGLDSRVLRVGNPQTQWYDVDFEAVITERKRYYRETENYRMISADIKDSAFLETLPKAEKAVVVLEGVSMYLTNEELRRTLARLAKHFSRVSVLVDCYTPFAAKMSKIKNPINDVGVSNVYGIESPSVLEEGTGLTFVKERNITPRRFIDELKGSERFIFQTLYAGKTSKKLYKLYEYRG